MPRNKRKGTKYWPPSCRYAAYRERKREAQRPAPARSPAEQVLQAVQGARRQAGLPPLEVAPALQALARATAAEEAQGSYKELPRFAPQILVTVVPLAEVGKGPRAAALRDPTLTHIGVEVCPGAEGKAAVAVVLASLRDA